MAVYKIFPTKDTTLYSTYPTMNTGLDAILEISNILEITGNPGVDRYLIEFDTSEIQDIINNKISGSSYNIYLKNLISTAQGISSDVILETFALAQSWNNGTGHFLDEPEVDDGSSWIYSSTSGSNPWSLSGNVGNFGYTGSYNPAYASQGGGAWVTSSALITKIN